MTTYGAPYRSSGSNWWRVDATGDDGLIANIHIADQHDTTAGEHVDYNARCSACWLGYAHSARVHEQNVARTPLRSLPSVRRNYTPERIAR